MDEFKFSLIGDGITVERQIDRKTALAILNSVLGSNLPVGEGVVNPQRTEIVPDPFKGNTNASMLPTDGVAPSIQQAAQPNSQPISLREFVNEYSPKTNAQIILCIAKYLSEHENIERFSREIIRPKFPAAGEPLPKNLSRDFQTAIDKGWIGEDPQQRDHFYITRTGDQQIKDGFKSRRN
jgi:hypothetical protein